MKKYNKIFETSDLKEIDRYTIEHEPISSSLLMKRAAKVFTSRLLKIFPNNSIFNIVSGVGNNGGDGFAIAGILLEKGYEVIVYQVWTGACLSIDCKKYREDYLARSGRCFDIREITDFDMEPQQGIWIDALFGAGLSRPVTGWCAGVIDRINRSVLPVVAVDVPSGLLGEDNAKNTGSIIAADYTLTFQFPKLSFMFPENYRYAGDFEVLDIGLHPEILRDLFSSYFYLTADVLASRLPKVGKFVHKGEMGHALMIAGSYGMMGAAILAAEGALHSGVGLLTLHLPRSLKKILHLAVPETLIEEDVDEDCFTRVSDLSKYRVVGIGPGIGISTETALGLECLLKDWKGRMVLDADALNLLAADSRLLKLLPEGAVLTPHPKEFERLAGKSENDFDRLNKLSIFAGKYNVYVVLKGAHSVVATPEGKCYFNTTGNSGMAKGGSGDVLTGIITGLLASGMPILDATLTGVCIHGMAGDLAREEMGIRGMKSGDIVAFLGKAWRKLETLV